MNNQPNYTNRYELNRIKDMANRTIRALDEQTTVDHLNEHIEHGLCTEVEAWHLVSGQQLWQILERNTEQYGLYGWV